MRPEVLERLKGIRDTWKMRDAIAELCRPFGEIVRIDVERDGDGALICLVDMAKVGQNAALSRHLGGFSYGLGVGFRIPVAGDW